MILIIDDDASVCASLALLLKQAGYPAKSVQTPADALAVLQSEPFEMVFQDMNFSRQTTGEEGLALLAEIKQRQPLLPVVLMTAWGSIALAVQGVRKGAVEFITKPWTHEQILTTVKTVLSLAKVEGDKPSTLDRQSLDRRFGFEDLVGQNQQFLEVLDLIGRVSSTDASVLITGESGTGKELIAEALHQNSHRSKGPFVKVNLGGMSINLFESEMFGHIKGAFTDAKAARRGRFEMAHRGTIFLDEIGDLDAGCQVKLLRVLQDRSFEPLGSSQSQKSDVRVVSATNQPLQDMVDKGSFREDLLYRLNLIAVHLPALRDRRDDISLLVNHFLKSMARIYRRGNLAIDQDALQWLSVQDWPGNVRQLKQTVERAVLVSRNPVLSLGDFQSTPANGWQAQGLYPAHGHHDPGRNGKGHD